MNSDSCPSPETLRSFVHCSLSEREADQIGEHLEGCATCEKTVSGMESGHDTVAEHIRKVAAEPSYAHEPECRRLMNSLLLGEAFAPISAPAVPPELQENQLLRDYQIVGKIGQGGMGTVYKAIHRRLKRTVAIKVLPVHSLGNQSIVSRFEREMEALGRLDHPHIVRGFDAGEQDGTSYLVMEYVEGCDLSELVRRHGPLGIADACQLIAQAADGLQYAYEHGYVHRDIKPTNLMLTMARDASGVSRAIVKILDLGLARVLEQSGQTSTAGELTAPGQLMGTVDYMAPEQGGDAHQVDIRADIYSLGATLYKLITGRSPYLEHTGKPPLQRLMAIAQSDPPAIRTIRPEVPEKLALLIHRLLSKQAANRLATPRDVVQAMEPFCAAANLEALLGSPHESRVADLQPSINVRSPQSGREVARGRRWKVALAGFAVAAMFAAVLLVTTRKGTVEVTAPNGKLPDDVVIVVSRDGQEVELLQADNRWSAKFANGDYQIHLRSGGDKFQLQDSRLTVSRMGKTVIELSVRPPAETNQSEKQIAKTPAAAATQSVGNVQAWPPIAPAPEQTLPDREKPFARINPQGKVIAEHRFANEALAVLAGDETLEVHGNGPFKLGKIVRNNLALRIRAGRGYRPRFLVDFDVPSNRTYWLQLENSPLEIEGCDFVGKVGHDFSFFVGHSEEWSFKSCRLIQPWGLQGTLIAFNGKNLLIRDSLLASNQSNVWIGAGGRARFENNLVVGSSSAFALTRDSQSILFNSNTLFNVARVMDSWPGREPNGAAKVVFRNNRVLLPGHIFAIWGPGTISRLFDLRGSGNLLIKSEQNDLWISEKSVSVDAPPKTIDGWNAYWNQPGFFRADKPARFTWDFYSIAEDQEALQQFRREVVFARRRHPKLPNVGPDIDRLGSGAAYDVVLKERNKTETLLRPAELEGGPFVIVSGGEAQAGFSSLAQAVEKSRADNVIEIRSDGPFPVIEAQSPPHHLTLRPGRGYHPKLEGLKLSEGDWTIEGLHVEGKNSPTNFACSARRVRHCTIRNGFGSTRIAIASPTGRKEPAEVVDCYIEPVLSFQGSHLKLENCVASGISSALASNVKIELSHSCIWSLRSPAPGANAVVGDGTGNEKLQVRVSDCLIDAEILLLVKNAKWHGERNLYRIQSPYWAAYAPEGSSKNLLSLADLQKAFGNDSDSQTDDSVLFRPEMWRER